MCIIFFWKMEASELWIKVYIPDFRTENSLKLESDTETVTEIYTETENVCRPRAADPMTPLKLYLLVVSNSPIRHLLFYILRHEQLLNASVSFCQLVSFVIFDMSLDTVTVT